MVKLSGSRLLVRQLSGRGDFVGRGLPPRWRSGWDDWLQRGLALAATTLDDAALRERLRAFAPWRYVALPAPGEIGAGSWWLRTIAWDVLFR